MIIKELRVTDAYNHLVASVAEFILCEPRVIDVVYEIYRRSLFVTTVPTLKAKSNPRFEQEKWYSCTYKYDHLLSDEMIDTLVDIGNAMENGLITLVFDRAVKHVRTKGVNDEFERFCDLNIWNKWVIPKVPKKMLLLVADQISAKRELYTKELKSFERMAKYNMQLFTATRDDVRNKGDDIAKQNYQNQEQDCAEFRKQKDARDERKKKRGRDPVAHTAEHVKDSQFFFWNLISYVIK